MKTIIKYKCSYCGKEYETEDEALACEEVHKYLVTEIINHYKGDPLPTALRIVNRTNGLSRTYVTDDMAKNLEWKLYEDICKDIHIGDCYLVKTLNNVDVAIVTGSLSNPAKLDFIDYNTKKNIDIYATTVFAKITIPSKDDVYKILYGSKLDKC